MARLVRIVTAAAAGTPRGNRVTADRWQHQFQQLGWRAEISDGAADAPLEGDLLVGIHAGRSHAAVARWAAAEPRRPVVVALSGTDVYRELSGQAPRVLETIALADRLVAYQPRIVARLPPEAAERTRVLYHSCEVPDPLPEPALPPPAPDRFRVLVLANLRRVKDPLAAAEAATLLPEDSAIEIVHFGEELDPELGAHARSATSIASIYVWLGEVPRPVALATLAQSHLLCLTSLVEGGPNAIVEALALGVPVVATRVDGVVGLLGDDYPGLFEPGDRHSLAALLDRAAREPRFLAELAARCHDAAALTRPAAELDGWRALLGELGL